MCNVVDADQEEVQSEARELSADARSKSTADIDELDMPDDEHLYYAPEKGNVVFASAVDGWQVFQ